MLKSWAKLLALSVFGLLLTLALAIRPFSPVYKGDGELGHNRIFSLFPVYEIYFPSFPLKVGIVEKKYRFSGVGYPQLSIRLYLLSQSGKRIKFKLTQKSIEFLDRSSIAVRILKGEEEIIDIKKAHLVFAGNGDFHYVTNHNDDINVTFSNAAIYDMQIVMKITENPPVPIKIQFALSQGYGCPSQSCEKVEWEDVLKYEGGINSPDSKNRGQNQK